MARTRYILTALNVKQHGPGVYSDGGGLALRVTKTGSRQWIYRYSGLEVNDKGKKVAKTMGLGGADSVPLAKARQLRDEHESLLLNGIDPIAERIRRREEAIEGAKTVREVAERAFKARKAQLKDDGKAGRWFGPIELHILPKLGDMPIANVTQRDIQRALEPIWHSKAQTAIKAINRLGIVMEFAVALDLDVDLQAVAKAKILLGQQRHTITNIPSMPWMDVPEFYASLQQQTPVQLALKLLILNPGPRSKPVRFLSLQHIEGSVWTVPAKLMKGKRGQTSDWRTPLSDESLAIIEAAMPFERNGYLFPNQSGKGVISDASMSRFMERRGLKYRPHGFRAAFRTWAAETNQRRDIAELCLAHKIHGRVEASYLRTDQIDDRAELMEKWSKFVLSKP